jgi:hypothetical protein
MTRGARLTGTLPPLGEQTGQRKQPMSVLAAGMTTGMTAGGATTVALIPSSRGTEKLS